MAQLTIQDIKVHHTSQLNLVSHGLAQNRGAVFAVNLVKTTHDKTDEIVASVRKKPEGRFDCKPGCSYCCHYRTEVLPAEVFLIAGELRKRPAEELEATTARLREHATRAKGLRPEHHDMPCPLLVDGKCSVYDSRPFTCRRMLSLDVTVCESGVGTPPQNEELTLKAAAVFNGTVEGYLKRQIPAYPHELGQALLKALEDPTCEERWFKGEQVFEYLPDMDEMLASRPSILVGAPPHF